MNRRVSTIALFTIACWEYIAMKRIFCLALFHLKRQAVCIDPIETPAQENATTVLMQWKVISRLKRAWYWLTHFVAELIQSRATLHGRQSTQRRNLNTMPQRQVRCSMWAIIRHVWRFKTSRYWWHHYSCTRWKYSSDKKLTQTCLSRMRCIVWNHWLLAGQELTIDKYNFHDLSNTQHLCWWYFSQSK